MEKEVLQIILYLEAQIIIEKARANSLRAYPFNNAHQLAANVCLATADVIALKIEEYLQRYPNLSHNFIERKLNQTKSDKL